ncbi:MAG: GNAT family N-acetyltransferase [Myxococcales bacterium]|nr:GNAT family N-acetyltransferase [Myxococcales bacterium]
MIAWLGDGLRPGRPGALERESPLAFDPRAPERHRVAWIGEQPAAHALAMPVRAVAGHARLPLGLIGSVYADPAHRGRGLARACIEDAVSFLRGDGACAVLLWSDLDDFYAPLGFSPVGRDWLDVCDAAAIARAMRAPRAARVGAPSSVHLPALEALARGRAARIERPSFALARMAAADGCELVAAFAPDGAPTAFAACGRGDDFHDVVHDWAGAPDGVLACLDALARTRAAIGLLSPPGEQPASAPEGVVARLRGAGATTVPRSLALARLIDAERLWEAAAHAHPALRALRVDTRDAHVRLHSRAGTTSLDAPAFLRLVLGGLATAPPIAATDAERVALAAALPLPLYVWGFDSI